jgi:hypothetical protein
MKAFRFTIQGDSGEKDGSQPAVNLASSNVRVSHSKFLINRCFAGLQVVCVHLNFFSL